MSNLRIGLSMRVVSAQNYNEPRDAIAHDWARFMRHVLPEAKWLSLPNIGEAIFQYVKDWDLNGIIITGGNDLFEWPQRDKTEKFLIQLALRENMPIFGVCRGFQVIAHYFGHKTSRCRDQVHVGTKHTINLTEDAFVKNGKVLTVNSYHENCGEHQTSFTGSLKPFAVDSDGLVEGVYHENKQLMAVMWHPERENPVSVYDHALVRMLFINSENFL